MTLLAAQTAEYLAATERCAVVDLSTRDTVRLTGPDRESFLQGMVTNDVEKLAVGASCPVAMLTAKGAMVGDGRVVKLADALLLDTGPGRGAAVRDFLNKYLISEEAEVADAPDVALVGLVGPEAETWAKALPSEAVLASLTGLLGAGVDVLVKREALPQVRAALASLPTVSAETFEVLRVEAGVPFFGVDMTETTIPLEANLEKAIHYQKGCYIGQEVIARATYRGQMNKKLVGLLLGDAAPAPGAELKLGDKRVGRLTSVVTSRRAGQNVALGYVHRDHLTPGTTLEVATGGQARVQALPFPA
ncbi:MAG: glycine cleavage T C-terminal barrel domain-containing protein [Myxococcaceae bacterium]|nr:glycine cleavage T C-terminal barrel domain-containing protein [Myxococcaceae bacterium]